MLPHPCLPTHPGPSPTICLRIGPLLDTKLQMGTKWVYFDPFLMILCAIHIVFREDSHSGIRIACFLQKRAKNSEKLSPTLPGPSRTLPVPGSPDPGSPSPLIPGAPDPRDSGSPDPPGPGPPDPRVPGPPGPVDGGVNPGLGVIPMEKNLKRTSFFLPPPVGLL